MGRARSLQLAKAATRKTGQGLAFLGKKTGEGLSNLAAAADEAARKRAAETASAPRQLPQLPQGGNNKVMQLSVHKGKKFYG